MNLVPILVVGLLLHSDCRGWYNSLYRLWNNYNYLQLSFWDSRPGASTSWRNIQWYQSYHIFLITEKGKRYWLLRNGLRKAIHDNYKTLYFKKKKHSWRHNLQTRHYTIRLWRLLVVKGVSGRNFQSNALVSPFASDFHWNLSSLL